MNRSEAKAIIAEVQAFFPRPELPASTVEAWASELGDYDFVEASRAARELVRSSHFQPALADLIDAIGEIKFVRQRAVDQERRRQMLEEGLQAPPDVAEALKPYWDKFGGKGAAIGRRARDGGFASEERIEAIREATRAKLLEGDLGVEQPRREPTVYPPGKTACGAKWGTPAKQIGGRWCCPVCESPISEGCLPQREEAEV